MNLSYSCTSCPARPTAKVSRADKESPFLTFTHQQILHFGTFGYLTLRGLFSQPEMAALRDEVTSALTDAFGQLGTEPDQTGGISGDYLPLAVDQAPFNQSLIADDERTFLASAELLGGPVVPSVGIATCFTGDSTWHTRLGPAPSSRCLPRRRVAPGLGIHASVPAGQQRLAGTAYVNRTAAMVTARIGNGWTPNGGSGRAVLARSQGDPPPRPDYRRARQLRRGRALQQLAEPRASCRP